MNIIAQEVSKIVSDILVNLLYAGLVSGIGAGMFYGKKLWSKWHALLDSKLTASQHQLLDTICQTAVVYVGKQWQEKGGPDKFALALTHVLDVAKDYGINVSVQDVQAKIEAAYQMSKSIGSNSVPSIGVNSDAVVNAIATPVDVSLNLDGKQIANVLTDEITNQQRMQSVNY